MAHTPGPWRYDGISVEAEGETVAWPVDRLLSRGDANARLIAAAPRLLAALETISDTTRMEAATAGQLAALLIEIGDTAAAAIREATGESK